MPSEPDGGGVLLSRRLLEDLLQETYAAAALQELFTLHGRRPFHPKIAELGAALWRERGARQHFARAIAVLHARGYIRWMRGGRYRIVTRDMLTAEEFRNLYPNADWRDGIAWATEAHQ